LSKLHQKRNGFQNSDIMSAGDSVRVVVTPWRRGSGRSPCQSHGGRRTARRSVRSSQSALRRHCLIAGSRTRQRHQWRFVSSSFILQ